MQFLAPAEQDFRLAVAVEIIDRQHLGLGQLRQALACQCIEDHEVGFAVAVLVLDGGQDLITAVVFQVVDQARAGGGNGDVFLVLVLFAADNDLPQLAGRSFAVLADRLQTGEGRIDHDQAGARVFRLELDGGDRRVVRADGRAVARVEGLLAGSGVEGPNLLVTNDDHLGGAVAVKVGEQDQRRVEHAGHVLTNAEVRALEAMLEAHEPDGAALRGRRGRAAGGGRDLQSDHAR